MKNKFHIKNKYAWSSWRDGICRCDFGKGVRGIGLAWDTPSSNVLVAVGSIGDLSMVWQKWNNRNYHLLRIIYVAIQVLREKSKPTFMSNNST